VSADACPLRVEAVMVWRQIEITMPTVTKAGRYEIVSELGRGAMASFTRPSTPLSGVPWPLKPSN